MPLPISRNDPVRRRTWLYCAKAYADMLAMLTSVNAGPRVLDGTRAILAYLNDPPPRGLALRTVRSQRITWNIVSKWAKRYGFPLCSGINEPWRKYRALSMERNIDAWVLTRPRNGVLFMGGSPSAMQGESRRAMRRAPKPKTSGTSRRASGESPTGAFGDSRPSTTRQMPSLLVSRDRDDNDNTPDTISLAPPSTTQTPAATSITSFPQALRGTRTHTASTHTP